MARGHEVLSFCLLVALGVLMLNNVGDTLQQYTSGVEAGIKELTRLAASKNKGDTSLGPTLLSVQVVHRHGARTPLSTMFWPETEYSDCSNSLPGARLQLVDEAGSGRTMSLIDLDMPKLPGGCRMGQLTHDGYDMAINLGKWLRQRYVYEIPLLSPEYQASEAWLRSTRIQRAVQTLQGVLTGLWPNLAPAQPEPDTINPPETVKVYASDEDEEYEYAKVPFCPALEPLQDALQQAIHERDEADPQLPTIKQHVTKVLGIQDNPAAANLSWVRLYDTLAAMKAHTGTDMPQGYTPEVFHTVMQQAVRYEGSMLAPAVNSHLLPPKQCNQVPALSVGLLLWHLQNNMQAAAEYAGMRVGSLFDNSVMSESESEQQNEVNYRRMMVKLPARPLKLTSSGQANSAKEDTLAVAAHPKLHIYSGHDSTITPMLTALGVPETEWPPFTGHVVLELWHRTSPKAQHALQHHKKSLWVRVMYNKEPMNMISMDALAQAASEGDGNEQDNAGFQGWISMEALQQRLQPYTLNRAERKAACMASA